MKRIFLSATAMTVLMLAQTASSQVTGSGTTGKIPKWTGSTAIGNSIITESSAKIGINATPVYTLDVFGNQSATNTRNFRVTYPAGSPLSGTELSGLTHLPYTWLGSQTGGWTAVYGKQGSAAAAGVFDGQIHINVISTLPIPAATFRANQRRLVIVPTNIDGGYNGVSKENDFGIFWAQDEGGNYTSGLVLGPHNGSPGIRIAANGNVGIGVKDPLAKLTVDGLVCAKEVRVALSGAPCWPDYVFDKSHTLKSIEEVEAFVNKNHHLPGIPAANEIEATGIILGEMQTKQMEKIEELYLYIMEMNKKLKVLEKENAAMKMNNGK